MKLDLESLKADLAKLREESQPDKKGKRFSLKVDSKGMVCVYGLGRYPIRLPVESWNVLFKLQPQIAKFLEQNASKIAVEQPVTKE